VEVKSSRGRLGLILIAAAGSNRSSGKVHGRVEATRG
jgi:hypothetical protein